MILTLLVDLDNTLLGNPMDTFLPAYLQGLALRLSPYAEPKLIIKALMDGTRQMVGNLDPGSRLVDVFDAVFYPRLGIRREDVQPAIDQFYAEDFPKLKKDTQYQPKAVEFIKQAFQCGWRVGIATNALFPKTAILQRLGWAGLPADEYPFALIPSYQDFHFAKPNPAYFAEFLGQLGWRDKVVVMVGDNQENDIKPAQELGLKVYWVRSEAEPWMGNGGEPAGGDIGGVISWIISQTPESFQPEYSSPSAMLAILRSTPAVLELFSSQCNASRLVQSPVTGEWSPTEILCHLRDVEMEVNLPRIKKVLGQTNPFLRGEDTDRWAVERQYIQQDARQALKAFLQSRLEVIQILESLAADEWERPARHAIFGPTRLGELVNIIAGHDRLHIQQFHRTVF